MADETDDKFERMMALVERLLARPPAPPPIINVNIDLGSLTRAMERRRAPKPQQVTTIVNARGPSIVPG